MIKLREIMEALSEPIPKFIFHATFNALIPEIKREGLIPHGRIFRNFEDIEWGVYLSNDKEFAGSMIEASENENIPEEWLDEIVICVIDTSLLDHNKFDKDPNINLTSDDQSAIPHDPAVRSYIYKANIPPQAIKEIVDFEG